VRLGVDFDRLRRTHPTLGVRHRSEHHPYRVTLHDSADRGLLVAVKGRPDEVLACCERWWDGRCVVPLCPTDRAALAALNDRMAAHGNTMTYPTKKILWDTFWMIPFEFESGVQAIFSDLEQTAYTQQLVPVGTPGGIKARVNQAGVRFDVRAYIDANGKRREEYLGTSGSADTSEVREAMLVARRQKALGVLLKAAGYQFSDRKTFDTLAVLHNHGVFAAGATLLGSHAYGALMNSLGFRAPPYMTQDVAIGRRESLKLVGSKTGALDLRAILKQTGLQLVDVPGLDRKSPSTSLKERGASRFRIDLLAPSGTLEYGTIEVPELSAHAATLPFLGYLLGERVSRVVLGPRGAVSVVVPAPARFALHKVLVSQLRANDASKSAKDLQQAGAVIEALTLRVPDDLEEAALVMPRSAVTKFKAGLIALERTVGLSEDSMRTVNAIRQDMKHVKR